MPGWVGRVIAWDGSMSNGDTAGWACPIFESGMFSLSTRRCCRRGQKGSGCRGKGDEALLCVCVCVFVCVCVCACVVRVCVCLCV